MGRILNTVLTCGFTLFALTTVAEVRIELSGFITGEGSRTNPEYCSYADFVLTDGEQTPDLTLSTESRYGVAYTPDDLLLPLTVNSAWRRDGVLYTMRYGNMSSPSYCRLIGYDEQGIEVTSAELDPAYVNYKTAYDAEGDKLYSWVKWGDETAFVSWSTDSPGEYTKIASFAMSIAERPSSLARCPRDGNYYYTDNSGALWSITPQGARVKVRDLCSSDYLGDTSGLRDNRGGSGLVWCGELDSFLWSYPLRSEAKGVLARIPADTSEEVEVLWSFDADKFIAAFIDMPAPSRTPAPVQISDVQFTPGSYSASVTYRLPSVTEDGDEINDPLDWTATVDGKEWKQGTTPAGGNVTVTYDALSRGEHTLGLYVSLDSNRSEEGRVTRFFGYGAPDAVEWVKLEQKDGGTETQCVGSWSVAERSTEDAPLDHEHLSYDVYLNGEVLYAGVKEEYCDVMLPEADGYQSYTLGVRVRTPEGISDIVESAPYGIASTMCMSEEAGKISLYTLGGILVFEGIRSELLVSPPKPGIYVMTDSRGSRRIRLF